MNRIFVILIGCIAIVVIGGLLPASIEKSPRLTYLSVVQEMRSALKEKQVDEPRRIILMGGSSLAYSVSAKKITEDIGIPTYNLGAHAGIGYINIYTQFKDVLRPGKDLIVVSPEYGLIRSEYRMQTTYCESLSTMSKFIFPDNLQLTFDRLRCGVVMFKSKLVRLIKSFVLDVEKSEYGFNKYGDYVAHYNAPKKSDDAIIWTLPRLDVRPIEQELTAKYTSFLESLIKQGYEIVYVPTIVGNKVCNGGLDKFYRVNKALAAPSYYNFTKQYPFCMPNKYFYDTSYHMNFEGVVVKTGLFIDTIKAYLKSQE